MSTLINISPQILPAINPQSLSRNGQIVPAIAMTAIARGANQVARWRTKELYSSVGGVQAITASAGAGPTTIARAYAKTGPYCSKLRWFFLMARPTGSGGDPYVKLTVTDSVGGAIGSGEAHMSYAGTASDVPSEWGESTGTIDCDPSTVVVLTFTVGNNGRMIDALVIEESKRALTLNGYFSENFVNTGSIFDSVRAAITANMYSMWIGGGAHILNWTGSRNTSSATDKNLIDGTSTTVTAATPGYTLDMRYKARLRDSATGVACKLAVWGQTDSGTDGFVEMKNSAGTVVGTVSGFTAVAAWHFADVTLPATLEKYDFMYSSGGANVTFSHMSMREEG